jgi:hypothetical protein
MLEFCRAFQLRSFSPQRSKMVLEMSRKYAGHNPGTLAGV